MKINSIYYDVSQEYISQAWYEQESEVFHFYAPLTFFLYQHFFHSDHLWQVSIYNVLFYILNTAIKSLNLEEKEEIRAINMLENCLIYSL